MEIYFSAWTLIMFILTVFIAILGFSLMQQSMNKILRQMDRQMARQEEVWQRLFAKADNTERLTQEILARLAPRDSVH
jgi:type II secretory pathway component PulL